MVMLVSVAGVNCGGPLHLEYWTDCYFCFRGVVVGVVRFGIQLQYHCQTCCIHQALVLVLTSSEEGRLGLECGRERVAYCSLPHAETIDCGQPIVHG